MNRRRFTAGTRPLENSPHHVTGLSIRLITLQQNHKLKPLILLFIVYGLCNEDFSYYDIVSVTFLTRICLPGYEP